MHAALARDRQLAAESRARAEALRSSARRGTTRVGAPFLGRSGSATRLATDGSRDAACPRSTAASRRRTGRRHQGRTLSSRSSRSSVAPDVRVGRAEPRRSLRFVAGVIAAAAVRRARNCSSGRAHLFRRSNSTQQQPPPQPTVDYSAILQQGLDEYQRGEVAAAIRTALSIPESAGERQQALEFLQTIRARRRGTGAGGATRRRDDWQDRRCRIPGGRDQTAGSGACHRAPPTPSRAVSLLAEASRLYRQAAETGLSTMDLLQTARRELQANRIPGAIEYALRALTLAPGDEDARCISALGSDASRAAGAGSGGRGQACRCVGRQLARVQGRRRSRKHRARGHRCQGDATRV